MQRAVAHIASAPEGKTFASQHYLLAAYQWQTVMKDMLTNKHCGQCMLMDNLLTDFTDHTSGIFARQIVEVHKPLHQHCNMCTCSTKSLRTVLTYVFCSDNM